MKIGFLLCAYNQEEFISDCLRDLVKFSKENGHLISAVSVPFKEYEGMDIKVDNTIEILKSYLGNGIDALATGPQYISEAEARNLALESILKNGCTHLWLADADEFYSYEQLNNIVNYLEIDEFIDWYSVSLKNYVGEGYLEEPFAPPRIFKVNSKKGKLTHFFYDNDVMYGNFRYEMLSHKVIPKEVAWPDHYSWTNTEKNRLKIEYQKARGWQCSYKWDNGVVFNKEYYRKTGQPMPKIIVEN